MSWNVRDYPEPPLSWELEHFAEDDDEEEDEDEPLYD